jgi:hypothetical protein
MYAAFLDVNKALKGAQWCHDDENNIGLGGLSCYGARSLGPALLGEQPAGVCRRTATGGDHWQPPRHCNCPSYAPKTKFHDALPLLPKSRWPDSVVGRSY